MNVNWDEQPPEYTGENGFVLQPSQVAPFVNTPFWGVFQFHCSCPICLLFRHNRPYSGRPTSQSLTLRTSQHEPGAN